MSLAEKQYLTRATLERFHNVNLLDNLSTLSQNQTKQTYRPYSVEKQINVNFTSYKINYRVHRDTSATIESE